MSAEWDVVVVGGGVAGLTAASGLAAAGRRVLVVSEGAGSTRCAQGGVAAAVGAGDSPEQHAADTLEAGAGACDPVTVAVLTAEGPARVADLVAAGADFDREGDGWALGREGGHRRRRVLHAAGDATGVEVARTAELRAHEAGVHWREGRVTGLLMAGRGVCGVVVGGTEIRSGAVVLATGGLGHAYPTTTNPEGVSGDGLALALLAGATLADVEFVQFHPTALWTGAAYGRVPLVTEALRGEGAVLRDAAGEPLMRGRHPLGDLAPRDVVARAVHESMRRDGQPRVWLDTRAVPDLEHHFPGLVATCRAHGLDPRSVPVAPAQHYLCGGVLTDAWGATGVPGLYAVGEVAATGVHGANRLASNSLLEGLVFGHRLAERLVRELPPPALGATEQRCLAAPSAASHRARELLGSAAGLVRDGVDLAAAREALLAHPAPEVGWLVAVSVLGAAGTRRESRGCHTRSDEPLTRAWWRRRIGVRLDGAGVPQPVAEHAERAA